MRDASKVFRQVWGDFGSPFDYGGIFINDVGQMKVIIGADDAEACGKKAVCMTDWTRYDDFNLADNAWIDPESVESCMGLESGSLQTLPNYQQLILCAEYYGWHEFGVGDYGWTELSETEFNDWERFNC